MKNMELLITEEECATIAKYLVDDLIKIKKEFNKSIENHNKQEIEEKFKEYIHLNTILTKVLYERSKR